MRSPLSIVLPYAFDPGAANAGGRKPWLAITTNPMFPPIPHSGVR